MQLSIVCPVEVTQEHINNGIRFLPRHCPIALAIKNNNVIVASVSYDYALILLKNDVSMPPFKTWKLDHELSQFIIDFDRGNYVKPMIGFITCKLNTTTQT